MAPERRAVLLLVTLAVAGQGLRVWAGRPEDSPGDVTVIQGGVPGAPRAHRDSAVALARPLAAGERIDLDRASAEEITRLPRIGLSLARTIVADRVARGPFGSLAGLDRVPGIGPGLLAAIQDHTTFSGTPRMDLSPPAGAFPPGGTSSGSDRAAGERPPLDLNSATAAELERLPHIGAHLAGVIVAFRDKYGRFPVVDSLTRVPGIGPATVNRLRGLVRAE